MAGKTGAPARTAVLEGEATYRERIALPPGAVFEASIQDVAIAVLESFGSYDPSRPFVAWAVGIARHAVADSLRKRARRPIRLGEAAADALAAAVIEVSDTERQRLVHLSDCIRELDGRAREVCDLRYRLDLSPARIGELLGIQPNTAAKALQRVREQLRECIERRIRAEARA